MTKTKITYARFDEKEDEIVTNKSEELGISKAGAIRLIIREWAEMKKGFVTVPVVGTIKDGIITIQEELDRR